MLAEAVTRHGLQPMVVALFLVFISIASVAQTSNIKFRHITNENGLSQNSVKSTLEDNLGFLWFGTNEGLNKYDGNSFHIYKSIRGDSTSLKNNNINIIYQTKDNTLWIGSHKGLQFLNRDLDNFVSIDYDWDMYVNGIKELSNGKICVTTYVNFFLYDPIMDTLMSLYNDGEYLRYDLFTGGLLEFEENKCWVATKKGLFVYDYEQAIIEPVHIANIPRANELDIEIIFRDSFGNVWIGTNGKGLYLLKNKDDNYLEAELEQFYPEGMQFDKLVIKTIEEDNDKNLWVGTADGNGIFLINIEDFVNEKMNIINLRHGSENKYSVASNDIGNIYKDGSGTMWVGTRVSGLSYYNKSLIKFNTVNLLADTDEKINHNYISSIFEEDDYLWVGTANGLNKYHLKTGEWEYFKLKEDKGFYTITSIYKDTKGNLWTGAWAGGLSKINDKTGEFTQFMSDESDSTSINCNNIFDIEEAPNGDLWITTMGGGLNIYNHESNTFYIPQSKTGGKLINNDWLKNLVLSKKGEMWIASGYGLYRYNFEHDSITHYRYRENNPASLATNSLVGVFEDKRGNIWVATENGLCAYSYNSDNFTTYSEADGLPNTVIRGLYDDNNGDLWISTNNGLSRFVNAVNNHFAGSFISYNTDDGLQGKEFNSRSCFRGSDGTMFFGGTNGFNYFNPDSIPRNNTPPKIILSDFLIFNKRVEIGTPNSPLKKHISISKKIVLNYDQSVLTFKYAALNFLSPERNVYKYRMDGFDKDWNEVGSRNEATYTNLNPGEYTFTVLAANNDGVWNEEGTSIKIIILPPWWETTLFKVLLSISLLGLIAGIYYWRINQLEKQKRILKILVEKKTTELRDHANSLNRANAQLEERQRRVLEQAEELQAQTNELAMKNEDLKILNSTKDKFFSIIAHDLKNPFSAIIGMSELLIVKYDNYSDERRKEIAKLIFESGTRSFDLLENLLTWSRAQTGRIKFSPETFFIFEILVDLEMLVKDSMNSKNIKFIIDTPRNLEVYADKNMIKTILRNLITNAVKFCENCSIIVNSTEYPKHTEISVIDEGIGMDKQIADKLFKIEKGVSTKGTRGESGTGLGLIICQEFIEYHHGSINVDSAVGKGSTFTITIPKN